jgi:hypothetical protein
MWARLLNPTEDASRMLDLIKIDRPWRMLDVRARRAASELERNDASAADLTAHPRLARLPGYAGERFLAWAEQSAHLSRASVLENVQGTLVMPAMVFI